MQSLEELRRELDEIDEQIIRLYEKRMTVCENVAEYKIRSGRKVLDKVREKEKLEAVAARVSDKVDKKGIQGIFEQLMSRSCILQYRRLTEELAFDGTEELNHAAKVRLCFEVSPQNISISQLLSNFVFNDIKICHMESRTLEREVLLFMIDIENELTEPNVVNAVCRLREEVQNLRILGNCRIGETE